MKLTSTNYTTPLLFRSSLELRQMCTVCDEIVNNTEDTIINEIYYSKLLII